MSVSTGPSRVGMMSFQKLLLSSSASKAQILLKSASNTNVSEKQINMWYMGSLVDLRDSCKYLTHNTQVFSSLSQS